MNLINLVRFSLVLTFFVIMLGAYTRLADAGLGCPDWPGCYGQLSVPTEKHEIALANSLYPELTIEADKAWLEMIHRYFAGTLGLVIFVITTLALRGGQLSRWLSLSLTAVVVFQALLGMWTVTMKLMPIVVMGHLLGGFTLFSLLALSYWQLQNSQQVISNSQVLPSSVASNLKPLALASLLILVCQIALGGWTSSNYAALMCTSLPICQGEWISYLDFKTAFELIQPERESYEFGTLDYGARMTIHVSHRLGAMLAAIAVGSLAIGLFRTGVTALQRAAVWLIALLVVQIALGIGNVLLSLPLAIAIAHNLGAALLLLTMLRANYLLWSCAVDVRLASIHKESLHE